LPAPPTVAALTWEELKNATYLLAPEQGGPDDGQLPLQDGQFEWTPVPGSASVERYLLYRGVAFGDLNGDLAKDAVVVLVNVSAGSGNFYYVIPVLNDLGQPRPLAATYLGDRIVVEDLRIADQQVDLQFKTYRPEEPFGSTPTLRVDHDYQLGEQGLELIASAELNADEVVNTIPERVVVPIVLPEGHGSVSFAGRMRPFTLDTYTLHPVAGQQFSVTVESPHQDAFLSLVRLGETRGVVSAADELSTWTGIAPQDEEYEINVFAIGTDTHYTLTVEMVAPAAPATPERTPTTAETPVPEEDKVVYLTFDDGPTPPYTGEVLDLLAMYDAQATFFVLGQNAERYGELVEVAYQAGHTLGNHTYNHPSLSGIPHDAFNSEILRTAEALRGMGAKCLRPPYGATDSFTRAYAAELGYSIIMWNIDTLDWKHPGPDAITATVLNQVYPGAIVLMHDGGGNRTETVAALETFLRKLSGLGYVMQPLCR
jgi:peptidoglycan/xylan/chitin deacetylase (PgdA/CDA1 family)